MKTFSKLGCFAAVTALLLSGWSVPVSAQERLSFSLISNGVTQEKAPASTVTDTKELTPAERFEISNARCEEMNFRWCGATTVPGATVRQFIRRTESSKESVLVGNNWPESMLDAEIPVRKFFSWLRIQPDENAKQATPVACFLFPTADSSTPATSKRKTAAINSLSVSHTPQKPTKTLQFF